MNSYLSHRTQYVKSGNNISKHVCTTCGIPQENALQPLLYLVFLKDIYKSDSEVSFHLFTDDVSLFLYRQEYQKNRKKQLISHKNI